MKALKVFGRLNKIPLIMVLAMLALSVGGQAIVAHSPHDDVTEVVLSPTYSQDRTLFMLTADHVLKSIDGGFSWKETVKGLTNKHLLTAIALSQTVDDQPTVFVASNGDGIFRSEDSGTSWTQVNQGLDDLAIVILSMHPDYPAKAIVLAAGVQGGLYRSADNGDHWQQVMPSDIKIRSLVFPKNAQSDTVFAGDQAGNLHRSANGGESWQVVQQLGRSGGITALAASPVFAQDATLYVGTQKKGVFKSTDGGLVLAPVNKSLSKRQFFFKEVHNPIVSLAVSPDYQQDTTLFASTWDEAIYISTNGAESWTLYDDGLTKDAQADTDIYLSPHFRGIVLSDNFSQDKTLFLGGFDGLFKSVDGGHSWFQLETLPLGLIKALNVTSADNAAIAVGIGTYGGGGYFRPDMGDNWQSSNVGLSTTRLSDIAFSPNYSQDQTIFSGASGALLRSTNSGQSWERLELPKLINRRIQVSSLIKAVGLRSLGNALLSDIERERPYPTDIVVSPDYADDQTVYFGTRWHGVYRSTDGGDTVERLWDGLESNVVSIVLSPSFTSDQTLFASIRGEGVFRSVDGGQSWQMVNSGLKAVDLWDDTVVHQLTKQDLLLAMSSEYNQDQVLFAASSDGLYKTSNGGDSWQQMKTYAFNENGYLIGIGISPNFGEDQTLLVSVRGEGLFKSEDGGTTFEQAASGLIDGNHAIELISFSPHFGEDQLIYAASDEELFLSMDRGETWQIVSRPVRYENMREVVTYEGDWTLEDSSNYSAQNISLSATEGDSMVLNFVGSGVSWVGTRAKDLGTANVYLDGTLVGEIDLFSELEETQAELYAIDDLSFGHHTLQIEVTGDKNAAATGTGITVDAFDISP